MGEQAIAAVFDPLRGVTEIAAALVTQHIERAIAEQAVELLRRIGFVTWKVLAVFVLKKGVVLLFVTGFHRNHPSIDLVKFKLYEKAKLIW